MSFNTEKLSLYFDFVYNTVLNEMVPITIRLSKPRSIPIAIDENAEKMSASRKKKELQVSFVTLHGRKVCVAIKEL